MTTNMKKKHMSAGASMKSRITKKQDLLMYSLTNFYCKNDNIGKFLEIIDGHSNISLRIIDWFVTNYSKKNNTNYLLVTKRAMGSDIRRQLIVYLDYKSQLKAFSKKQFDPFCRRERIMFYYTKDKYIITTVGQLNFFRWAIQNNVLKYIEEHLEEIETDMNTSIKHIYCKNAIQSKIKKTSRIKLKGKSKKKKPTENESIQLKQYKSRKKGSNSSKKKIPTMKQRKKRKELSVAATNKLNKHATSIVVKFD